MTEAREESKAEPCADVDRARHHDLEPWWRFRPLQMALASGVLLGIGFVLEKAGVLPSSVALGFYLAAIPIGAFFWVREGIEELVEEHVIGIEVLMAAAAAGAGALGLWEEAAFLVFLYGAAEALEEYTVDRTRHAIRALLDLAPAEARVLREGRETSIPAQELAPGDVFLVRPGERIATDGVVVEGSGAVDESPVTGEHIPADKAPRSKVFAGSLNLTGALKVRVTSRFEDNTLSKIIHLVETAQSRKGQAQVFIERFGRRYSPLVLATALGLLAVPAAVGLDLGEWAHRAVVLLVAAAPCALVMSTPVAIAAGIGRAGRLGVLVKGGMTLERLGRLKVVALDKTGTLTRGEPVVTDVVAMDGVAERRLLELAASVEHLSEHPVARAIVRRALEAECELQTVEGFEALPGAGARAKVAGEAVVVARPSFHAQGGVDVKDLEAIAGPLRKQGKTLVAVRQGDRILGLLALQDQPRPEAAQAVKALHAMGIKLVMLTGDNRATAEAVAALVGIDQVHAELRPEEKVQHVEKLREQYGDVAMVGDGINDAPALAAATVGIAMGAAGTDAAIEAADVALMADDLEKLSYVVRLGRQARRISRQNIAFSLLVLGVLVPTALLGALTVAVAVLAHETSELLAVANGLRTGSKSPA